MEIKLNWNSIGIIMIIFLIVNIAGYDINLLEFMKKIIANILGA